MRCCFRRAWPLRGAEAASEGLERPLERREKLESKPPPKDEDGTEMGWELPEYDVLVGGSDLAPEFDGPELMMNLFQGGRECGLQSPRNGVQDQTRRIIAGPAPRMVSSWRVAIVFDGDGRDVMEDSNR